MRTAAPIAGGPFESCEGLVDWDPSLHATTLRRFVLRNPKSYIQNRSSRFLDTLVRPEDFPEAPRRNGIDAHHPPVATLHATSALWRCARPSSVPIVGGRFASCQAQVDWEPSLHATTLRRFVFRNRKSEIGQAVSLILSYAPTISRTCSAESFIIAISASVRSSSMISLIPPLPSFTGIPMNRSFKPY